MMPSSDPPYRLEVSRTDLAQALKIISRAVGKRQGDASFRFHDGRLSIEADNTAAGVPARGTWPLPIFVGSSWIRRLARRMPAGDPLHLRVDEGRLHANRYSEPCAWTPREQLAPAEPLPIDENLLIQEAARILKPLRIRRSHLEELVSEARARGTVSWSVEEKKMIAIVAKAWVLLAPLGVETSEIRRLVDNAVRNAWK
jgi:hypothetical protein